MQLQGTFMACRRRKEDKSCIVIFFFLSDMIPAHWRNRQSQNIMRVPLCTHICSKGEVSMHMIDIMQNHRSTVLNRNVGLTLLIPHVKPRCSDISLKSYKVRGGHCTGSLICSPRKILFPQLSGVKIEAVTKINLCRLQGSQTKVSDLLRSSVNF